MVTSHRFSLKRILHGILRTHMLYSCICIHTQVADDDLSQRLLLKRMLSGIAYECEVVENGALAIERTAQVCM
jgi:hypothetical protein